MPFSGTVSSQASLHRSVSGSLGTLTGGVNKKVGVSVAGVLGALTGSVSYSIGTIYESVAGVLGALTGSLSRRYLGKRTVSGVLNATGEVTHKSLLKRSVSGVLSFTGAAMDNLLETFQISVAGTLGAMTGTVASRFIKAGTAIARGLLRFGMNLTLK